MRRNAYRVYLQEYLLWEEKRGRQVEQSEGHLGHLLGTVPRAKLSENELEIPTDLCRNPGLTLHIIGKNVDWPSHPRTK